MFKTKYVRVFKIWYLKNAHIDNVCGSNILNLNIYKLKSTFLIYITYNNITYVNGILFK